MTAAGLMKSNAPEGDDTGASINSISIDANSDPWLISRMARCAICCEL